MANRIRGTVDKVPVCFAAAADRPVAVDSPQVRIVRVHALPYKPPHAVHAFDERRLLEAD